jgi:hypothetical protein
METHLDRHPCYVKPMGKEDTFAQQTLIPCGELDFGDSEGMSQVQGPVHVRVGEVSEPFWKLFVDLCAGEARDFVLGRGVGFEDVPSFPVILVPLFQGLQIVPFSCLPIVRIVSNRADDAKGGKHLCEFEGV